MQTVQSLPVHGGMLRVYDHQSRVTGTTMRFAAFVPPQANDRRLPCLWYLSGLTCTWANVMEKGEITRAAADHGMIIIAPDTSPRGEDVPDEEVYDLGQGAGFYLTATEDPWAKHFRMDRYVTDELQKLCVAHLPIDEQRQGIMGHSMGGHGALSLHLKNPDLYKSCSAFAPISALQDCPWGEKAILAYLGEDREKWAVYDASALVRVQPSAATILIDQGTADPFLAEQLRHAIFEQAASHAGQAYKLRMQEGYDHSYYFIATFMQDHVRHHAEQL